MPNPMTKKAPTSGVTATERNLEEQIRTRAYELYEERGREEGHDLEDWLQAEAEITGRTVMIAAA